MHAWLYNLGMSNARYDTRLGNQIKAHREAKDLSRDELARLTGLTTTTIYRLETGRSAPSRESARLLADVLGMSATSLLTPVAKAG